jgi:hypothetical protein
VKGWRIRVESREVTSNAKCFESFASLRRCVEPCAFCSEKGKDARWLRSPSCVSLISRGVWTWWGFALGFFGSFAALVRQILANSATGALRFLRDRVAGWGVVQGYRSLNPQPPTKGWDAFSIGWVGRCLANSEHNPRLLLSLTELVFFFAAK